MQTLSMASMRIRLQKCSLVGVETLCKKNDSASSVAALLSFVETVNWGGSAYSTFQWIGKRGAVVLIAAIETGDILFHGKL